MHVSASSSGSISFFSGEAWQRVEGATVHAVVSVSAIHLRSPPPRPWKPEVFFFWNSKRPCSWAVHVPRQNLKNMHALRCA